MAIVIIILIIIIFYYYNDSSSKKEELIKEKGKIKNFEILINKLKAIPPGFNITYERERDVKITSKISEHFYKILTIETSDEKLYIKYILYNDKKRDFKSKEFDFTIYNDANRVAEVVKIGMIAFEDEIRREFPEILN